MKRLIFFLFILSSISCFSKDKQFYEFQSLFKKIEIPFSIDSTSIFRLIDQQASYPRIFNNMKQFIPEKICNELFKEQNVRAYFNIPLSKKFISLVVFSGSVDECIIYSSKFYLINYNRSGEIIDYIKIGDYYWESNRSWCTILEDNIKYHSFEFYSIPDFISYDVHDLIPIIEKRFIFRIDENGHFSKEQTFCRKGFYQDEYGSVTFTFYSDFPKY